MKSKFQLLIFFCIISLFVISCSADQKAETVDLEKARVEIQALEDAFAAAEKAKDANAVASYYSQDAISYSRNQEPAVGRDSIRAQIERGLAKDTSGKNSVYKVVDLFAEGDLLVEIGSWTTMNAAGETVDKGHYMSCFKKRDGKYECIRDMNVSSTAVKPVM